MKKHIVDRVLKHALLFIQRDENVRSVAKRSGWSKSTVFRDLASRLKELNPELNEKVKYKLEENKVIGYMKGGYALQEKMLKRKEKIKNGDV